MDEELLDKLSSILSEKNININDILENFQNTSSSENASEETNDFSKIDPATLLKLQKIMSLLNSKKTNSKDATDKQRNWQDFCWDQERSRSKWQKKDIKFNSANDQHGCQRWLK